MIHWIYERDAQDINGQIRLNMFTLTKDLQEKAIDAHVENYRNRRKVTQPVTIGEYKTEVNFKREDEEYGKVTAYFTAKRDEMIGAIQNWKAYAGFGVGAAAVIGAFAAGYWLFVVALLGLGYGAVTLISNRAQVRQLEQGCAENIQSVSSTLGKIFAEFRKYQAELDGYDSYYARIKNELGKI